MTDKGPPLSIAWDHIIEESYDLRTYERFRKMEHRRPRSLRLSPSMRVEHLLQQGHTWKEIRASERAADKVRKQRERTMDESSTRGARFLKCIRAPFRG